jgi:hypothetical protein
MPNGLLVIIIMGAVLLAIAWYLWNDPSAVLTAEPTQLAAPQAGGWPPANVKTFHIVSSHWNEDVSWLPALGISYSICDKKGNPNYKGTGDCDVPQNAGRECSAYLQWIINHYDNLPAERIAFIHGHENAWHQQNASLAKTLELAATHPSMINEDRYTSLNDMTLCLWRGCPRRHNLMCDEKKRRSVMPYWDDLIAPHLDDDWPTTNCCSAWGDCCAQFVLTKELILRYPKSTYETMLKTLLENKNDVEQCFALETVWHAIYGEKLCADWDRDCPIDHTIGARLQDEPDGPACLTARRP